MAKYYTAAQPTPVFAVTFISNRKGIVPEPKTISKPTQITVDNSAEIKKLQEQLKRQQAEKERILNSDTSTASAMSSIDLEISNTQLQIANLTEKSTVSTTDVNKSQVPDDEYLIYSNVQIQPISDTDLSQQSNWYLRDADVELTRDWPICKAKLIVTCKFNKDGSIPSLTTVEQGFTYSQTANTNDPTGKSSNFTPIPSGRFLSADDEVRIYAGYKSNTCVSMNDLDQFPFSFNGVQTTPLTPAASAQLTSLEAELKATQTFIDQLNNGFTDPNIYLGLLPIIGSSVVAIRQSVDNSGRLTYNSNTDLLKALNTKLASINRLIAAIQRTAGVSTTEYTASNSKPLAPIFWGFIDSVDFIGNSSAGIQIIYNLRDRSRILADTKIITIPFLNAGKDEKGAFEGLRHKTIEGVYRAANGGLYLDNSYTNASSSQWRENFNVGSVITLWDNSYKDSADPKKGRMSDQVKSILENTSAIADERIKFNAAIEDPAKWVIANAFLPNPVAKYDPMFHIWTLQPPLVSGSGPTTIQIINKSPFEILTYMQTTEVMPIDVFCSHVNGHFMFAPRVLDTTGLNDPERGNRLYFFFECFDKAPASRSLIKDIRVSTSTIGVYNRFTVSSADFNNPTNSSLKDIVTVVDIASANSKNKKIPIKQQIIVDPKIKDAGKELVGNSTQAAAQALALTTASTVGKDNITVMLKVIGDSTFYPGEAIRVYNTVLHSNGILTYKNSPTTQSVFLKTLYEETQAIKNKQLAQGGTDNKIVTLDAALEKIRSASGENTSQVNQVLPMYKVRAITHSLKAGGNDAGYTTKIVAVGDIL